MYSETLLRYFQQPKRVGLLPAPALRIEATNPVCGDLVQLSARVENGVITESGFLAKGCTASIATASALAEWSVGRTIAEMAAVTPGEIEALVDGLPNESKHAAQLAADAAHLLARR